MLQKEVSMDVLRIDHYLGRIIQLLFFVMCTLAVNFYVNSGRNSNETRWLMLRTRKLV